MLQVQDLQMNELSSGWFQVSPPVASALSCESVRATARRSRDAVDSGHAVSKRAFELLHQFHLTQDIASLEAKERSMAALEVKLENDAANLALKHNKETTESEAARIALFQEFDAKRKAWATVPKVEEAERLLAEEGSKHTDLIESMRAKHLRYEEEAEKVLREYMQKLESSGRSSFW